tara:strand:+ start:496 stop:732 length:237 start_codon:yes stop_codon:yes gene_type:complete
MGVVGIALRGFGKALSKIGKKKPKKKLSPKQKRIKKENKKVAGLAAAALTGTAGYVGALYKKNLQDYPETGKNLKKSK